MSIVIDVVLLAFILLTAFISAKYGFVRTVIELVGFALIIFAINTVSIPLAEAVYDSTIQKDVVSYSGSDQATVTLPSEDFIKSLPGYLTKENGLLTVDKQKIDEYYNANIKKGAKDIAVKINNDVIRPATVKVLSLIISAILFMISSVAIPLIARLLNGLVSHTFAKGINEKLGFVIGLFKGVLIVLVLCLIIMLYTANTNKGIFGLSKDTINNSYIIGFIRSIMPDYGILSYLI